MIDLSKHKLELEYPCQWCYKIILLDKDDPHKIAKDILQDREHNIKHSNASKKGKFKSYDINLTINSDEDRTTLHKKFNEHKDIKMVI